MGQNIHSMLPKQNFDKSIMSGRCPSIFCPYFWPIAWRAHQRIGGSILHRMSLLYDILDVLENVLPTVEFEKHLKINLSEHKYRSRRYNNIKMT